jgi:hypothetical protein
VPFLKQIFRQETGAAAAGDLEQLTPEEYARRRAEHIRSGKGTPPAGATPLPIMDEPGE